MDNRNFPQRWLNLILHLSSFIYKLKESLYYSGILQTFLKIIFLVLLEILLAIISLPFYFFLAPEKLEKELNGKAQAFRLRRKVTLAALLIFLVFELLKLFSTLTGIVIFPFQGKAQSWEWTFDQAEDYIFDSPYLKVKEGRIIFDPTLSHLSEEPEINLVNDPLEKNPLLEGNLETEADSKELKIKLADVQLKDFSKGEVVPLETALTTLTALTTTEEDLEKAILRDTLQEHNEEIVQEILEDKRTLAAIENYAEKDFFESLKNKVEESMLDKKFQEELSQNLEDSPEVEEIMNEILTGETEGEIIESFVTVYLQKNDEGHDQNEITNAFQEAKLKEIIQTQLTQRKSTQEILLSTIQQDQPVQDDLSESIFNVSLKGPSGTLSIPLDQIKFQAGSLIMSIDPAREFIPGLYKANIDFFNPITGKEERIVQDFLWGVLAINTDRDVYQPDDTARIQIGVLNDQGAPVCDAEVLLEVQTPRGKKLTPTVKNTGQCVILDSSNILPDYETSLPVVEEGQYYLKVTATLANGQTRSLDTTFESRNHSPYVIERQAATRLYPAGMSPMTINVHFNEGFEGVLTDILPASFQLGEISSDGSVKKKGLVQEIQWITQAKAGETKTFEYFYDAPDQSPEFYTVGPIQFSSGHEEARVWQIANDEVVIEADSTSDLRLHWKFNQGTGTSATDSSSNALAGTLTNMEAIDWITATPTLSNQNPFALDFDGTNEYVTRADTPLLDFADTADFTLTGWFNRDTFNTDDTIIAKRNGIVAANSGYILRIDNAADRLELEVSDGVDEYSLRSTTAFNATGWNHFAVVWDQDSPANSEIYINGVANAATDTGTIANIGDLSNALAFRVGAESDAGLPFDGKIDDVRVYNRVLTQAEITTLAGGNNPGGSSSGLQLWMRADSGVTTSGSNVTSWASQAGGATFTQGTAGNQPVLTSNAVNFNSAITFDGINDRLTSTFAGNPLSVFSVIRNTDTGSNERTFYGATASAGSAASMKANDVTGNATSTYVIGGTARSASTSSLDNEYYLHEGQLSAASNGTVSLGINGLTVSTLGTTGTLATVVGTALGSSYSSAASSQFFQGQLAETIVYNTAKTGTERQRILAYLALKYGITLSQSDSGGGVGYLNSAGTTIWSTDTSDLFEHDIAGIGRDDNSALNQTQSKSINSDAILRVSQANSQNNLDFLMWSNNNGSATWTSSGSPSGYQILSRRWQAQETNSIGTVDLEFDVADSDFNVPALLLGTSYYFVYDSDNDALLSDETPLVMTDNGTAGDDTASDSKWTVQVDFPTGGDNKIDFAIATESASPPTVTDANISINSGTGTGGAFKVGDQIIVNWNNSALGDNNASLTSVTADLSGWGGSATTTMTDTTACGGTAANNIYEACFTLISGSIDAINVNASVSATNSNGTTTTSDSSNAIVDNQTPIITTAAISVTGATGTGGAFKLADTATGRWDNSPATGDGNLDIVSVSFNLSDFLSTNTAVAGTSIANIWTASITGSLDVQADTNNNVTVTATDDAGNQTSQNGTNNYTVDTQRPTITAITSVAGDTAAPYYDNTDNGNTSILFTSTDIGTGVSACRWNASNVSYSSMTNACASTSNCISDLTGEGNKTVYLACIDGAGNTTSSNTQVDYVLDGTGPSGTSITPDATRIIDNSSPSFTVNDGTDFSGIDVSTRTLERQEAIYSNNTCGTFGSFTSISFSGSYPTISDATASGSKCYIYRWSVADNAGNSSSALSTTIVRVPLTTLVISDGDNQSYGATNNPIGYTLPTPLKVRATDGGTNYALAGEVVVSFAITSVPTSPIAEGQSLSATNVSTDSNGYMETSLTLGDRAGNYLVQASSTSAAIANTVTFTATEENYFNLEITESNLATSLDPLFSPSAFLSPTLSVTTNAGSYDVQLTPNQWPLSGLNQILNWNSLIGFGWNLNGGLINAFLEALGNPSSTLAYSCTGTLCQGFQAIDIDLYTAIDFMNSAGVYSATIQFKGVNINY